MITIAAIVVALVFWPVTLCVLAVIYWPVTICLTLIVGFFVMIGAIFSGARS
jgi:hypothetical protein